MYAGCLYNLRLPAGGKGRGGKHKIKLNARTRTDCLLLITARTMLKCRPARYYIFFFLSFNLLIGWQFSIWNYCKPFYSLLYNCQLLCLWRLVFEYFSRGFPTSFFPDIAPSRMFTTNLLCLILCPLHEWRLFFKTFKSNTFFFRPLKNFINHYSICPIFSILLEHRVSNAFTTLSSVFFLGSMFPIHKVQNSKYNVFKLWSQSSYRSIAMNPPSTKFSGGNV